MKVGIIIRSLDMSGGAEREAIMLARELKERKHTVTMYAFTYDKEKCFPELFDNLPVVTLAATFLKTKVTKESSRAKQLAALIDINTDILNPFDQVGAEIGYYFKKRIKNVPSVLMLNDLHIHQWSLFQDPLFHPKPRPFWKRWFDRARDEWGRAKFLKVHERIAVLNDRTVPLVKKYLGRDAVVVRSGVDHDHFPYRPRHAIFGKKINLLCHAIFYIHRRFEDPIAAVKILLDAGYEPELTIIGDYEHKDTARAYYRKLFALVSELGLESRVRFAGRVSEEELSAAYSEADIFIFSSHMQTWGLAVFEALVSGLPVIVSRTAGASEVLSHGENALLVDPGDPQGIAQAVCEMADNPLLYGRLSKNGSEFVESRISWSKYADQMLALFKEVREKA